MALRQNISPQRINAALQRARSAVALAREVREEQRRHRRPDRVDRITKALGALDAAMVEVRPLVHAAARRPLPKDDNLRAASEAIQKERRKLKKMLATTFHSEGVVGLEAGWSS